jgi:hypothetical protein
VPKFSDGKDLYVQRAHHENQVAATSAPELNIPDPPAEDEPGLIYRTVYRLGYFLSFGVMFPTFMIVRAIPLNNAFGDGLCDGTLAAKDTSARAYSGIRRTGESIAQKASDVYAGVTRSFQDRVEAVQDALAERRYRQQIAAREAANS